MFRIIILFFLCQLCTERYLAQNDISSSLMELEQEIYASESDSISNQLILQKIDLYLKNNDHSQNVLQEIKRINFPLIGNDSVRMNLFWNASLIAYFNEDIFHALNYFDQYETIAKDTTLENDLLKIVIYSRYNPVYSSELIQNITKKSSKFQCLECLNEVEKYALK